MARKNVIIDGDDVSRVVDAIQVILQSPRFPRLTRRSLIDELANRHDLIVAEKPLALAIEYLETKGEIFQVRGYWRATGPSSIPPTKPLEEHLRSGADFTASQVTDARAQRRVGRPGVIVDLLSRQTKTPTLTTRRQMRATAQVETRKAASRMVDGVMGILDEKEDQAPARRRRRDDWLDTMHKIIAAKADLEGLASTLRAILATQRQTLEALDCDIARGLDRAVLDRIHEATGRQAETTTLIVRHAEQAGLLDRRIDMLARGLVENAAQAWADVEVERKKRR